MNYFDLYFKNKENICLEAECWMFKSYPKHLLMIFKFDSKIHKLHGSECQKGRLEFAFKIHIDGKYQKYDFCPPFCLRSLKKFILIDIVLDKVGQSLEKSKLIYNDYEFKHNQRKIDFQMYQFNLWKNFASANSYKNVEKSLNILELISWNISLCFSVKDREKKSITKCQGSYTFYGISEHPNIENVVNTIKQYLIDKNKIPKVLYQIILEYWDKDYFEAISASFFTNAT
jgi:hypothetical protein